MSNAIYPTTEYDRPDVPVADHWFWAIGDVWSAVVAAHEADWFASIDEDGTIDPDPRVYPIKQRPPFGMLHYRDANRRDIYELADPAITMEKRLIERLARHNPVNGFPTTVNEYKAALLDLYDIAGTSIARLVQILGLVDLMDDSKGDDQISGSDFIDELVSFLTNVGLLAEPAPVPTIVSELDALGLRIDEGGVVVSDSAAEACSNRLPLDDGDMILVFVEANQRNTPPYWVTMHPNLLAVEEYLRGQEYPDDWEAEVLFDRRDGTTYDVADNWKRVRDIQINPTVI